MAAAQLEREQRAVQTGGDGTAAMGAHGHAQARAGGLFAQVFFDAVEVRDLAEDPACGARCRCEGFVELAPGVRPASGQPDVSCAAFGEGGVGAVAVALEGAGEVGGDDFIQARGGAAGLPVKEHAAAGPAIGPEVALLGFAVAGFEIADGCFIDLDVTACHHSGAHRFVDWP